MKPRLRWTLLGIAYVAVLGAPFVLRPAAETWEADTRITILSPHWEGIKYEFRRGFRQWYLEQTGKRVDLEWLDVGGTSDIMRFLDSEFKSNPEGGQHDIVFGGGGDFFNRLKNPPRGYTHSYRLPDEILATIPESCAGVPVYDPDHHWYGAAMSGFGIIYNKKIFRKRGLDFPKTWEDLARSEVFSWVSAADPGKSGAVHMMFEIVLQAYGWERGMDLLARMGANARSFSDGSSDIPMDVARGETALGMCIDFYAARQIVEVGTEAIGFVLPEGLTVINPDPICILKNAPHLEESKAFVRYVMSRPGQQLWMYREGVEGGPARFGLARLAVAPGLYGDPPDDLLIDPASNPFARKAGFHYESKKGGKRWQVLNDFIRASLIDTHEDAIRAWDALIKSGFPEELDREFGAVPVTEDQVTELAENWRDAEFREKTRSQWVRWFRDKYQRIAASL